MDEADRQNDNDLHQAAPAALTDKQRDVLELLIEHKTSKQIARELGISPHTVDQRLMFARDKLGARNRTELAMIYRDMLEGPERTAYGFSGIDANAGEGEEAPRGEPGPITERRIVPKAFDGRHGGWVRMGVAMGLALGLVLVVLGTLAIYVQLSRILAG